MVTHIDANGQETKSAIFAGGCFWCIESDFEKVEGIIDVASGYSGGSTDNPTYEEVSFGGTGYLEVIKVEYNPEIISYHDLLKIFWVNVDPFDSKGQFCDKGDSYLSAIFYGSEEEKEIAERTKALLQEEVFGREIAARIRERQECFIAEDYHQNYYKTNLVRYKFYRWNCGRDARLSEVWSSTDISLLYK